MRGKGFRQVMKGISLFRTVGVVALAAAIPFAGMSAGADRTDWMMQTNRLTRTECLAAADLPNVLVLGDSISIGYTPFLRRRLAGVAHVSRPRENCAATQFHLRDPGGMRDWVGTNKWDVITVNCGIWDVCYVRGDVLGTDHYWGPNDEERNLPPLERGTALRARGFRIRTPVCDYARNLREILTYLTSTGATVLFALTTPCPAWQTDDRCGLIRVYNEVAVQICRELSVGTVDLYAVGERNYRHQPDETHYDDVGNDDLAQCLEAEIRRVLDGRKEARHPL